MAIDLCSENSRPVVMSPRISFSHDLSPSDSNFPVEQSLLRSLSSSTVDFDFCIHHNSNQESASADELFSNGRILPSFIPKSKSMEQPRPQPPAPPLRQSYNHNGVANPRKITSNGENLNGPRKYSTSSESDDQKQKSKSFWQFKRSSSLNCGNGYARTLCPIPILSRSSSAGSATSSKRSSSSKEQNSQNSIKRSQFSSQKPPLKKTIGYGGNSFGQSHGNGTVRINPVLNVPSGNLFGLGSIFSSNKEKNKKKMIGSYCY